MFLKHGPLFIPHTSQVLPHPRAFELAVPGLATFSPVLISQDWPLLIIPAFFQGVLRVALSRSQTPGPSLCQSPSHPAVVFSAWHTSPAQVVLLSYLSACFCLSPLAGQEPLESPSLSVLPPTASQAWQSPSIWPVLKKYLNE